MTDKKCLACNTYRDECCGEEEACSNFKPIDFERVSEGGTNKPLVLLPPFDKPEKQSETRRQKFKRIGAKRQEQALEAIRKLEHLTSRYKRKRDGVTTYTYEWTAQEAIALVKPITEALANLQAELIACDIPYEHGMID